MSRHLLPFSITGMSLNLYLSTILCLSFDIWIAGKVVRFLLEEHGDQKLVGQEKLSHSKAKLIYDILDAHPETY